MKQSHDPEILRGQEYADDSHLDIRRRTHQRYTVDPVDFGRWTLEHLTWQGNERILDVGCGPGDLIRALARRHAGWRALVGLDFSPGMIAQALSNTAPLPARFLVADAQALPLPTAAFDVVMARHMLYHVPDIDRALGECARVLAPGGRFLATTNSANTMPQYHDLRRRAAARFPAMVELGMITGRFSLENAPALLKNHFDRVEVHLLHGTLRFPTARPFVDYFASTRAMTMRPGHSQEEWLAILDFMRAGAQAAIDRHGHFDVTKITGAITGLKRS
ncbi:MAG: class I SAM-dependent methyltransferase [Anaerolineae bacterium]|jgi:SAM-dependent methyltransferase